MLTLKDIIDEWDKNKEMPFIHNKDFEAYLRDNFTMVYDKRLNFIGYARTEPR